MKDEKQKDITNGTASMINIVAVVVLLGGMLSGFYLLARQNFSSGVTYITMSLVSCIVLFGFSEIIHQLTNIHEKIKKYIDQ